MSIKEKITREYLNKLDTLHFQIKGKMQSNYSGMRKSDKKGVSLEFSDFREYNSGDDIRRIDWKGFARSGRLNIKLFMEEKQAEINIFMDNSKSMAFSGKNDFAKLFACSAAYMGISNMDKVSVYIYNENSVQSKVNIDNKNRFMEIVDFIDNINEGNKTDINNSISMRSGLKLKKGLSIIISDFFDEKGFEEAVKSLQYMKQDIILVQVLSKEETEPTEQGSFLLRDSESGEEENIVIDEDIIKRYKRNLIRYNNKIKEFCRKRAIDYYSFTSDTYIIKAMNAMTAQF